VATVTKLHLFVHPVPRDPETLATLMPLWRGLIEREAQDHHTALCLLSNSPKEMKLLAEWGQGSFGERCFLDPNDNSPETKLVLLDDLERTLRGRGNFAQWKPYEIWSSNNARRWAEGLKRDMASRGFTYDPETLVVESCGQQWGGCLAKYSCFLPKYMGMTQATRVNAEFSVDPGIPMKARFVERIAMARHVWLFLFETADGLPMGQYFDGLRAVWEPPHVVRVRLDPQQVELVTTSPNAYLKVDQAARADADGLVLDVGDGIHPAFSTLVGRDTRFDAFKAAMAAGEVAPRAADGERVAYHPLYFDPITTSRDIP